MNAIRKISQIFKQEASVLWKAALLASVTVTSTYALYEFYEKLDSNRTFLHGWTFKYDIYAAIVLFTASFLVYFVVLTFFLYFGTVKIDNARCIQVRFRDVLSYKKSKGAILVGINDKLECTESEVAEDSLHWTLIRRANQQRGNSNAPTWIEKAFSKAKRDAKKNGFKEADGRYSNGYAFVAEDDEEHQFVFLVMSSLPASGAATTTMKTVCDALDKLFTNTKIAISNNRLYAPPIGTGRARLPNDKQEMAVSMAAAFAHAKTQGSLPVHKLVIIFRPKRFFQINMEKLYQRIKMCAQICSGCVL